jgi:hypothetical protein
MPSSICTMSEFFVGDRDREPAAPASPVDHAAPTNPLVAPVPTNNKVAVGLPGADPFIH